MIVVARLEITQMDEDGMLCSLVIILVYNLPSCAESISIVCVSNIIPNLISELLSNVS